MSEQKKYFVRSIKFNHDQETKLKKILNNENANFSTYVKEKIFAETQEQKEKYISRLKLKETLNEHKIKWELIEQIKRIGNNLNQIAKYTNQHRTLDIAVLKELSKIQKELERLKDDN